ncbi:MAG: hypothetical protein IJ154_02275 [Bacteroidales bacterium]|nr:hypothetical protein [Bacteroidales bacterium]
MLSLHSFFADLSRRSMLSLRFSRADLSRRSMLSLHSFLADLSRRSHLLAAQKTAGTSPMQTGQFALRSFRPAFLTKASFGRMPVTEIPSIAILFCDWARFALSLPAE